MSLFSVSVEPLAVLAGARIAAVCLGLLKGQAPLNDTAPLLKMGSVEANDAVHVSPC